MVREQAGMSSASADDGLWSLRDEVACDLLGCARDPTRGHVSPSMPAPAVHRTEGRMVDPNLNLGAETLGSAETVGRPRDGALSP